MRDIEFRGKNIATRKWKYGSLLKTKHISTGQDLYKIISYEPGNETDVIPETVGQFTGLTDKNGVKVFEGDIVLYKGMNCLVRWDTEKSGYFIGEEKYWMMNDTTIEVIGNIHDNPELLKECNPNETKT